MLICGRLRPRVIIRLALCKKRSNAADRDDILSRIPAQSTGCIDSRRSHEISGMFT